MKFDFSAQTVCVLVASIVINSHYSRGVNMYAMLVGKLPFRSPRQGTKKRQKLLEQISSGITEHHDKEMAHLSTGIILIVQYFQ